MSPVVFLLGLWIVLPSGLLALALLVVELRDWWREARALRQEPRGLYVVPRERLGAQRNGIGRPR